MKETKKDIILCGIGIMAHYVTKVIEKYSLFNIVSYTADEKFIHGNEFLGKPLVPFETVENIFPPRQYSMLLLIGYKRMRDREKMFLRAKKKGYCLPNCIAGNVNYFDDLIMGENNIIFSGTYICAETVIGNNNIIRPNVFLGHNLTMGDHCYISPGCNIGGYCQLEDMSFIGQGTNATNGIRISRENLIGAGSLLLKDTEPYGKYIGSPAVLKGKHEEEGITF